jgi:hypothetical protein
MSFCNMLNLAKLEQVMFDGQFLLFWDTTLERADSEITYERLQDEFKSAKLTHLEIGIQTHKMREREINWHKNGSDPLIV